jgi:hypothetical protein
MAMELVMRMDCVHVTPASILLQTVRLVPQIITIIQFAPVSTFLNSSFFAPLKT